MKVRMAEKQFVIVFKSLIGLIEKSELYSVGSCIQNKRIIWITL